MVAARTTTATNVYAQPPRSVHAGVTVREFVYSESGFHATVSSAILLAKLPPHCMILDSYLAAAASDLTTGSGRLEVVVGTTPTTIGGSFSVAAAATAVRGVGAPIKVSISDDAAVQYATLRYMVTTASSASVTLSMTGWVSYLVGSD